VFVHCADAWFRFKRSEDARKAFEKINGLELGGQKIRVGLVKDMNSNETEMHPLDDDDGMRCARAFRVRGFN
jgi:hypothetical protein